MSFSKLNKGIQEGQFFAWLWSTPLVSNCLLISTVYKCALVVLCGYLIPFLLSVFVLLRMNSLCCCWCRLLLSLCLIVVFLSLKVSYVPSMLFHVFKEIKIVPSQIYNFFIKTKIICVIRGNFLFSACSVHDQSFTNTIYCYREIVQWNQIGIWFLLQVLYNYCFTFVYQFIVICTDKILLFIFCDVFVAFC